MQSVIKQERDDVSLAPQPQQHVNGFVRTFSAFHHRNFRLFWSGQAISLIGTWMQTTGMAWLVLQLTHDAFMLGVIGALQFVPVMFFTLFGGVLADRLPKRRVLLFTQSFAMLQAFTLWLLVVSGSIQLWHLFILATLLGLTNALDMPTRQSFVSELVGREDLPNAVALNSSMFNMARIVGPGIGGLLIAWLGNAPVFLINAVSFIPVLIGLALINTKQLHSALKPMQIAGMGRPNIWQSLGEGFAYIRKTPAVFMIIAVVGWVSLFGINFNVTLPLFANEVLHAGSAGFGFISSAFGAGALLSALWLAWSSKKPGFTHIATWTLIFCILEALFAISHVYWLSLPLVMSVGFAQVAFSATANTALQTVTPDHLRGRIMSVYMLCFAGTNPIGNLFMGGMARLIGASLALLLAAGLSCVVALGGWLVRGKVEESAGKVVEAHD